MKTPTWTPERFKVWTDELGRPRDLRGTKADLKDRGDLLRRPQPCFVTNSCFEVGLSLRARLAQNDVEPPLFFLNASLRGRLAVAVGAFGGTR